MVSARKQAAVYQGGNTSAYDPGHGSNAAEEFRLRSAQHDTLNFSGTDFGNDFLHSTSASDSSGVVIKDPVTKDTVELLGINKGELARNAGIIAFHA